MVLVKPAGLRVGVEVRLGSVSGLGLGLRFGARVRGGSEATQERMGRCGSSIMSWDSSGSLDGFHRSLLHITPIF